MHDLAVLDGNDRDEAVVVGGTGPDYFTVYLVFDNHDTGILRSVRNERIRAMQDDVVAIVHIVMSALRLSSLWGHPGKIYRNSNTASSAMVSK